MNRVFLATTLALVTLTGCAVTDKAMMVTESGLSAAEQPWHDYYMAKADECDKANIRGSEGMEGCFGDLYDADAKVQKAVQSAVALLRGYWVARAAGKQPNLRDVLKQVKEIMDDLPPEARPYFRKVVGI